MALVEFEGGPLHNTRKRMDVYTAIIPITWYGWDDKGRPNAYYQNVNAHDVNEWLINSNATHYVFMINGVAHKYVDGRGNFTK